MFLPEPSGHRDVALGVCRTAGRVLLVRNVRSVAGRGQSCWDLPGGEAHPGESAKTGLAREWREEVGWDPDVGDLLLVVDGAKRRAPDAAPLYTWRAFLFDVAPPPFGVMPVPGPEIERVEIVATRDAEERLSAPYHAPLRALLRGSGATHATVSWVEPEADVAVSAAPTASGLRRLLVLAAAAAVGDLALVASEAAAAVSEGVDRTRAEETLLQVVPYAGFPRTLAAFAAARPALGAAAPSSDDTPAADRAARGRAAFEAVYADSAERVRKALGSLHPLLPAWTVEEAYGRVLSRPALSTLERELLAVSILTALGHCDDALLGHARAAGRLGATEGDVQAAIAAVPSSAGEGRRASARVVVARA